MKTKHPKEKKLVYCHSLCLNQEPGYRKLPYRLLTSHLLPNEFHAAVKYRLGTPMFEKEKNCPYCKTGSLNTLGDHANTCHGQDDMILRHNRLVDKIISPCRAANQSPLCEQKNLVSETNSRPGDVYLPCWSARQPAALGVTITFPLQPSTNSNAARMSVLP